MGERLAGGNIAIALLANTLATGAMLVALILTFGPISGAHFNPAVTLADASQGGLAWREVPGYLAAQVVGAFAGVAAAHLMFGEPVFRASRHVRAGSAQVFSEFVATFGLLCVIWGCARLRSVYLFLGRRTVRRGRLHHRGVLVHLVNVFCQPRGYAGAIGERHLRWDTAGGCAGIYPRATHGRDRGHDSFSMAGTLFAQRRRRGRGLTRGNANMMSGKKRVLILCTGNSARSQMAEGLLRDDAGQRFEVESAGTKAGIVRPEAIAAMAEVGIDISRQRSKNVDEFDGQHFDYVITVCDNARETCPVFFGAAERLHRNFEDPATLHGSEEARLAGFRRVRDELRAYLREFAASRHG